MCKTANYEKTKIYKLISNNTDKFYIGSTTEKYLSTRLRCHIGDAKRKKKITSTEIINAGDYKIILLENYPCNSIDEQKQREQHHLDLYNNNDNLVNTYRAFVTKELHAEENRQRMKAYYDKNRPEVLKKKMEKIECSNCGCYIVRSSMARHKKTDKCIQV